MMELNYDNDLIIFAYEIITIISIKYNYEIPKRKRKTLEIG